MKRKYIVGASAIIVVLILVFTFVGGGGTEKVEVLTQAKRGEFVIAITTTGELEAKKATKITGPPGLRAARLWNVKIDDLIDEGTVVKKGDYVASLDASELTDRMRNEETELSQSESKYTQTRLDTALTLREARDQLVNLEYAVEEKKLVLDQSQYEPPATIKQAEIDLEKAKRAFKQAKENYILKKNKAVAQMQEAYAEMKEDKSELDFLVKLRQKFKITAPEDGMVIYQREYDGTKKSEGSTIGAWDPTVATLPDLSEMISTTYVNEVDIRKINTGQFVNIGLDAFPEKKLTGEVVSVANVGEQRPNSDAKVFEVKIRVDQADSTLRPAMTTSNEIITEVISDAIYVPLESVFNQGDSVSYVYKKDGIDVVRQEVRLGNANANEVVIADGLSEGESVFLYAPEGNQDEAINFIAKK